jgi:iron complex transport system permease protein
MHVVVVIAVMVAASTALVGPVTFFGLIVANLAYGAVGHRHLRSVPAAISIGVIALVGGQLILARVLGFGTELPIVIEFAGGLFFIVLVLTGRAR